LQAEVNKNPARPQYHLALGDVAMRFGKYDLALREFFLVLRSTDKGSGAAGNIYYMIGEAYRRKGGLDYALIFLRQAKDLLPGNLLVLGSLALALDSSGQKEEAAREYQAALAVDPDNVSVLNNLAFLLSENGSSLDVAVKYAEHAHQLRPGSPAISDTLGWIYVKKNMTEQAIGLLRDAVQKDPARSPFHYHLAVALEQKADHAAALVELNAALQGNPSKDEARIINELAQKIGK
jgi:tetratricopeptide (TPR) repeat protein